MVGGPKFCCFPLFRPKFRPFLLSLRSSRGIVVSVETLGPLKVCVWDASTIDQLSQTQYVFLKAALGVERTNTLLQGETDDTPMENKGVCHQKCLLLGWCGSRGGPGQEWSSEGRSRAWVVRPVQQRTVQQGRLPENKKGKNGKSQVEWFIA